MDVLSAVVDRLARIAAELRLMPRFEWGVVTAVTPLTIRLDADPDPLAGTPSTLVSRLTVGDRVLVVLQNRRAIIVGRAFGAKGMQGDTDWVRLDGWTGGFAHSTSPVHYRIESGWVVFKGSLTNASWNGALTSFGATMPTGATPTQAAVLGMSVNSTVVRAVEFHPSGQIRLYGSVASGAWWSFDSVRYPLT